MDQKPQAIVHERHDSKEELERLFGVLKSQNSPTVPMRDRHLPQSFFSPPPNSSDGVPAINNTTATLSTDTNFGLGDNIVHPRIKSSPASFQYYNNNNKASTNSPFHNHQPPLHPKHHSSSGPFQNVHSNKPFHAETTPKNMMNPNVPMRQLPIASPVQQNSLHIRGGSGSGLHPNNGPMQAKLPDGWEKAYTAKGQLYFVNHITKTTSWEDPRRSMMQSQNLNPMMQMSVNNNMEIPNDKAMQELQMMQLERKQLEQKREEMLRKESEIKRQLVSFQRQQMPLDQFAHQPGLPSATGHNGIHNHNPATLIKHEPTSPSPMQVDNYQPSPQHNPVDIQANLSQSQMMNYHHGNVRMSMNTQLSNDGVNNQMMSETGNEPDIEELIQSLSATAQDLDIDANLMDRDAIAKIESELVNTGQNWY